MPEKTTLYYKDNTTAEMDSVDARRALRDHPSEWSGAPFPEDYAKAEAEKVKADRDQTDAQRAALEEEMRRKAADKAAQEQAARDVEATRIAEQQEEKRRADEAARNGDLSAPAPLTPVTNDGLKVGHIPSEVPALEVPSAPFLARDKGHGWWGIFDAKGLQIGGAIREPEAASFNELSDEDKAEYVKAETAKA